MPHFASDDVFDAGLNLIKNNCNRMVLTQGEPTSFANANTNQGTGSGQKLAEVTMASTDFTLANGDTSGRKVACAAKSSISVIAAGNGNHVAYLDTTNSRILHYYELSAARNGLLVSDAVNFPVHDFEIRDTVAE
jgi:hypothetical protein